MNKIYLIFLLASIPFIVKSQACTDLFISEYVEGSSYNKAIEIFNPTSSSIELSSYQLSTYFNGVDTTASNNKMILNGILASNDVYIVCNAQADSSVKAIADATNSFVANWNGNDAVVLVNILTNDTLDIIGKVGENPGSLGWPVDTGHTTNHTIVRQPTVQNGTTDWALGATQWYAYGINDFSHLGTHTMNACAAANPSLYFLVDTVNVLESAFTFSIKVGITNPNNSPTTVDVKISGGTATETVDYTFTNPTTITFPANSSTPISVSGTIIDDLISEPDETIMLSLSNQTNEATITSGTSIITIYDNDGLGIENNSLQNSVSIYPRITDGIITIVTDQISDTRIFDIFGNEVFSSKGIIGTTKVELTSFNAGIYFVEVKSLSATIVAKVMVK